jgi:hypothetical protein
MNFKVISIYVLLKVWMTAHMQTAQKRAGDSTLENNIRNIWKRNKISNKNIQQNDR